MVTQTERLFGRLAWLQRMCLLSLAAIPVFICQGLPGNAEEWFHNGSVGNCDGCHGRNKSTQPPPIGASFSNISGTGTGFMLNGRDPSSTCLKCHKASTGKKQPSGYWVATDAADVAGNLPPVQLTPGGDFAWLKKNYKWSGSGTSLNSVGTSSGNTHGHNIVAADFGYHPDSERFEAPGGSYPAEFLSCISCHDPHGRYRTLADGSIASEGRPIKASGSYKESPLPDGEGSVGSYRLLAGKGYQPKYVSGDFAFKYDPPSAIVPKVYNRSEVMQETRVAYGMNMSEWCKNCHVNAHEGKKSHPAGNKAKLSSEVVKNYNSYVYSGNMKGTSSTSYNSLVPFEAGTRDLFLLKQMADSTGTVRTGPGDSANVMCLTCHRAHATGWDHMLRWNYKSEILVQDGKYPGTDNNAPAEVAQGRTSLETQRAYYDRAQNAFSALQRSLCNKCHAKD